jgi:hypothetical protein
VPGLGAAERSANLARLWRHVAQMQRDGLVADMSGLCRGFLRAYEPRREERRELIRAIARAHKKYAGWHFASRALERGVGVKRAQPRP